LTVGEADRSGIQDICDAITLRPTALMTAVIPIERVRGVIQNGEFRKYLQVLLSGLQGH
jgi:hypothetical protein